MKATPPEHGGSIPGRSYFTGFTGGAIKRSTVPKRRRLIPGGKPCSWVSNLAIKTVAQPVRAENMWNTSPRAECAPENFS